METKSSNVRGRTGAGLVARVTCLSAMAALLLLPNTGATQYMYLDANGDGLHSVCDRLNGTGATTVDVYFTTATNRDGSPAACGFGTGSLDFLSYEFVLEAVGGTVQYEGMANRVPDMNRAVSRAASDTTGSVYYHNGALATSIYRPAGLYHAATLSITVLTGNPRIDIIPRYPYDGTARTAFGVSCQANATYDHMVRLGVNWFDVDGLGAPAAGPPIVSAPAAVTTPEGSLVTFGVSAADPDGCAEGTLTADLSSLPAGHDAVFTSSPPAMSGTFTWTPTYGDASPTPYPVYFTATSAFAQYDTTEITVADVDRAPVVVAPAAILGDEGALISFDVTASDPDGEPIASLVASGPAVIAGGSFTPAGDHESGTFAWTPGFDQAGLYPVIFIAVNALSDSATTEITVANVNHPPVFDPMAQQVVWEGETLSFTPTATDPDGDILIFFATCLPGGATIDPGDGRVQWTPGFADAGLESVCIVASDGDLADTLVVSILVLDVTPEPIILAITDIGNDQGRQVDVHWKRSEYDKTGDGVVILGYALYRRIDPLPILPAAPAPEAAAYGRGPLLAFPPGAWHYIATIPAMQETDYHVVAPTLADSTPATGLHMTTFFLAALTDDAESHYDGAPDSGYSVDNLPPTAPYNLAVSILPGPDIALTWNRSIAPDLRRYGVHRDAAPGFTPGPGNQLGTTTDSTYVDGDPAALVMYYKVIAYDYSGNPSEAAETMADVTGIDPADAGPLSLNLDAPYPNPARRAATLAFSVPRSEPARLDVVGIDGRLVKRLWSRVDARGTHAVTWDLRDASGGPVAAGVYLVRLSVQEGVRTKKIIVLR